MVTASFAEHLKDCTDEHVAEKYRQYRNYTIECVQELQQRGYAIKHRGARVADAVPTADLTITKTTTKVI